MEIWLLDPHSVSSLHSLAMRSPERPEPASWSACVTAGPLPPMTEGEASTVAMPASVGVGWGPPWPCADPSPLLRVLLTMPHCSCARAAGQLPAGMCVLAWSGERDRLWAWDGSGRGSGSQRPSRCGGPHLGSCGPSDGPVSPHARCESSGVLQPGACALWPSLPISGGSDTLWRPAPPQPPVVGWPFIC